MKILRSVHIGLSGIHRFFRGCRLEGSKFSRLSADSLVSGEPPKTSRVQNPAPALAMLNLIDQPKPLLWEKGYKSTALPGK